MRNRRTPVSAAAVRASAPWPRPRSPRPPRSPWRAAGAVGLIHDRVGTLRSPTRRDRSADRSPIAICGMTAGAAGHDHRIPAQPASPATEAPPPRGEASTEGTRAPAKATGELADRMAAALVHREPGWRLPRRSALARRYNVSLSEIDAAISDLARRSLVRRLPDRQLYPASPAGHWVPRRGPGRPAPPPHPVGSP